MDGIHRANAVLLKGKRQGFCGIGELQTLGGQCQNRKNLATSCLVRDARNLILQCFRAEQRLLSGLDRGQNRKNCFSFHPDSWLCLVVRRALQAAIVEIEAHRQIVLLLPGLR